MYKFSLPIREFARMTDGELLTNKGHSHVEDIIIDSRKFGGNPNTAFFAIEGERNDGHRFISDLYSKGLRVFVVSQRSDWEQFPEADFIFVENSLDALQKLAANHRREFKGQIIGITGSNGKTVVKEWIFEALHQKHKIVRSPKSYNSQVGVPLSLLLLNEEAEIALIEAGISKPGEMDRLAEMINPEIGIFTNIGEAHQENFESLEDKVNEKAQLFKAAKTIIHCADHELISKVLKEKYGSDRCYSWSMHQAANLSIEILSQGSIATLMRGEWEGKSLEIELPYNSGSSIENACHIWALMAVLQTEPDEIKARLEQLIPVAMRLEKLEGINQCVLINDAYNSDINSLEIALDYLKLQSRNKKDTAVISDIFQSGRDEIQLFEQIAKLLETKGIARLIGIGKGISSNQNCFDKIPETSFYETTEAFIRDFSNLTFKEENILIKGARDFRFEKITSILQELTHETVLEIDLTKLVDNLNFIRSTLKPGTKIMAMVKAFAYGSGSYDIARVLEYHRVDYIAVAYADEGFSLREDGIQMPIMVLNPEIGSFDAMIRYELEPQIYNYRTLRAFDEAVMRSTYGSPYPVHLKINTGMNRLGFDPEDLSTLGEELKRGDNLVVKSIFSHLAASDDPNFDDFTMRQIKVFESAAELLSRYIGSDFHRHILNSAGILRFPDYQFDMVRLGLSLYGVTSIPEYREKLVPINRLVTTISQIRHVKKGQSIGYNPKSILESDKTIGVIPIGYADGLHRSLSNGNGSVKIGNHNAPFIGHICMDMSMVDLTGIPGREGDRVEVFGPGRSIYELARQMGSIPYEVLTSVSQRVKRVFIQE